MAHVSVLVTLMITYMCFVNGQCPIRTDVKIKCKSLFECPSLMELVNKPDRTPQETENLKNARCGFEGRVPKVCCPEPCYTPEGKQGRCIGLFSCPHLVQLLQSKPVPQENMNYIVNSKCNGPEQYSVCCGNPQDTFVSPESCAATNTAFPPDPNTECCGVDSIVGNKIVGGDETSVDQYPWLVLIEYVKDGNIRTMCGGALISNRYVLTAAHCLTGSILQYGTPIYVRLAEYDTSTDGRDCKRVEAMGQDCTDGTVTLPIDEVIPHPQYNRASAQGKNDIGLIRLAAPAPFSDFIRPICLPSNDLTRNPPTNFTLYAAGWGAVSESEPFSNIKMHVALPYVDRAACQTAYRIPGRNANLGTGQICAGGRSGQDSCKGDSGGPLMYENGRIYELLGIVSFGPRICGTPGVPGVYSKVWEYNSWIRSNIRA